MPCVKAIAHLFHNILREYWAYTLIALSSIENYGNWFNCTLKKSTSVHGTKNKKPGVGKSLSFCKTSLLQLLLYKLVLPHYFECFSSCPYFIWLLTYYNITSFFRVIHDCLTLIKKVIIFNCGICASHSEVGACRHRCAICIRLRVQ